MKMKQKDKSKFNKRLLVNIAKGTTAWAGLTSVCALPMLMDAHPVESYFLGCMAVGVVFPVVLWTGTRYRDPKYVGQFYINLFDKVTKRIKKTNTKQR